MLISIVVPMYNVEKYIRRCLESLINQSKLDDVEILLINDGSQDSSREIAEDYAKKYPIIRIIDKENGGLSDARNVGIDAAKGKYILFVDSDDAIKSNTCEIFLEILMKHDYDIIACDFVRIEKNGKKYYKHSSKEKIVKSGNDFLKTELQNKTMFMASWSYIYKKEFLDNEKLRFKKGILHEDEEFTPRALLAASRVLPLHFCFYNYFINPNTITTKKNKLKNAEDLFASLRELEKIYSELEDNDLKKLLNNSLVEKYLYMFYEARIPKSKRKRFVDKGLLYHKAIGTKNKIKVRLFTISPDLYLIFHKLLKK